MPASELAAMPIFDGSRRPAPTKPFRISSMKIDDAQHCSQHCAQPRVHSQELSRAFDRFPARPNYGFRAILLFDSTHVHRHLMSLAVVN